MFVLKTRPKHVAIGRARFLYRWAEPNNLTGPPVLALSEALSQFLAIETDGQVLDFMRAWGPLGICAQHALPSTHIKSSLPSQGVRYCAPPLEDDWRWEPAASWREWMDLAFAIVDVLTREKRSVPPSEASQRTLEKFLEKFGIAVDEETRLVALCVSTWLGLGDPAFRIQMGKSEVAPVVLIGAFDAIGLALLQLVSDASHLLICSGCQTPYLTKGRRPQSGREHYCSACGPAAAQRDAQKRRRARNDNGKES